MTGSGTSTIWTLTTEDLLHPERFDLTKLKEIVESRGGMCEELSRMEDITKLYGDLVLPKPQRKYNVNTKLGRRLHENQQKSKEVVGRRQMEISMEVDLQRGEQIHEEVKTRSHNGTSKKTAKDAHDDDDEGPPPPKKRTVRNDIKWP